MNDKSCCDLEIAGSALTVGGVVCCAISGNTYFEVLGAGTALGGVALYAFSCDTAKRNV